MPVITNLRNPCLKGRHWELIETTIGQKLPSGEKNQKLLSLYGLITLDFSATL